MLMKVDDFKLNEEDKALLDLHILEFEDLDILVKIHGNTKETKAQYQKCLELTNKNVVMYYMVNSYVISKLVGEEYDRLFDLYISRIKNKYTRKTIRQFIKKDATVDNFDAFIEKYNLPGLFDVLPKILTKFSKDN